MSLNRFQKQLDEFLQGYETPYWTPHEILARISEEVGELARLINHRYGPKVKKPGEHDQAMGEEIADIIFALCCLANREGINLDPELDRVLTKAKTRDKDRFKKKAA